MLVGFCDRMMKKNVKVALMVVCILILALLIFAKQAMDYAIPVACFLIGGICGAIGAGINDSSY